MIFAIAIRHAITIVFGRTAQATVRCSREAAGARARKLAVRLLLAVFCLTGTFAASANAAGSTDAGDSFAAGRPDRESSTASEGELSLEGRPLGEGEIVPLDGEWEFHWMKLLTPEQLAEGTDGDASAYIRVPAFWADQPAAGTGTGHATYRLKVRMSEEQAGHAYGLYLPYGMESAYEVWINGEFAASAGKLGVSRAGMEGQYRPQVTYFEGREENEIVIRLSNYVQRTAGIWDSIRLGRAEDVSAFWNRRTASELFVAGGIVMMGLYHLGLYALRRKDRAPLYFGAFCLLFGLRSLLLGENYMGESFPNLGFETYKKMDYLGQYIGPALFILYVQALFPKDIHKFMVRALVVFDLLLGLTVLLTPAWVFAHTLPASHVSLAIYAPYLIYVFVRAAVRRREGALLCCILFAVMALTIVNDLLYYNNVIVTFDMAKFGLFLFVFAQAFLLSIKFSKAFRSVEELSERQSRWSHELEATVEDRTRDLSAALTDLRGAQKQLVEAEKMAALGGLVAGIAHEINTPVGIGVTAASHLRDKTRELRSGFEEGRMKRSELSAYLSMADESAEIVSANLSRAAELIRGFKQVAADQSSEERRTFNVKAYVREVLVSLGPQLKRTRIRTRLDGDDDLELNGYPGALSQIVTNLVVNSVTHAFGEGEEGNIFIDARRQGNGVRLVYRDDGRGMAPEVSAKIFDPFFTTNRSGGGTGLGMHIVFNLVTQSLGGSIVCDSGPGQGTTFDIYLPSGEKQA
ncbi:hypothetical protein CDO73_08940 [Saccharibacillus sp. O23]|uniref:ATP-binding protein n=1 Tax=Saccharibacillus sp. O23 TaxID=2009338 RepID=UPI000B4E822D|nr:ATP-binding protein [Saccharibacillus sp. O23]OWR30713.1 hypothetical protein CDO73_08940 [Saccharibacillus sp. O23]